MPRIILIETATAQLSTALLDGEKIVARRVSTEPRAHASMTAPFVAEMLAEGGLRVQDCDAVCVSKGPGSYTGRPSVKDFPKDALQSCRGLMPAGWRFTRHCTLLRERGLRRWKLA